MRTIALSGATRGIGRAIALKFAGAGFQVAAFSRSDQHLQELRKDIKAVGGSDDMLISPADAGNPAQVAAFAKTLKSNWNSLDVLVNNAGIFVPDNVLDADEGRLEEMMQINLFASNQLTRELVEMMPGDGSAYIFNLCSVASLKAYPAGNLYAITKHAMLGFSRALRQELLGRVRVSNVIPGATYTDSWMGSTDLPEERFMDPDDVANMIWQAYNASSRTVIEDIVMRPLEGDI